MTKEQWYITSDVVTDVFPKVSSKEMLPVFVFLNKNAYRSITEFKRYIDIDKAFTDAFLERNIKKMRFFQKMTKDELGDTEDMALSASRNRDYEMFCYLSKRSDFDIYKYSRFITDSAIFNGNVNFVEWIIMNESRLFDDNMDYYMKTAFIKGHVGVLELLMTFYENQGNTIDINEAISDNEIRLALIVGNYHILQWMLERNGSIERKVFDKDTIGTMYVNRRYRSIEWLVKNYGIELSSREKCFVYAGLGKLHESQYVTHLLNIEQKLGLSLLEVSASNGHYECSKFLFHLFSCVGLQAIENLCKYFIASENIKGLDVLIKIANNKKLYGKVIEYIDDIENRRQKRQQ